MGRRDEDDKVNQRGDASLAFEAGGELAATLPPATLPKSFRAPAPAKGHAPAEPAATSGERLKVSYADLDATLPGGPGQGWQVPSLGDRYELIGLLGRGGMGEVYEARDTVLGRHVALKFLRGPDREWALRLVQEARAQALIDHPNVCKVYEAGEPEGKPYIAMQLVRGKPLSESGNELTLPEKVRAMKQVAEAVHEAHRLGVIHRDLKPSNILLGRGDDGRWAPMVMDFGLAYEINRGHDLTVAGARMGTPSYMAPEQVRGEVRSVDRRSDVYGLGATFYELLTGKPPFAASTAGATMYQVLNDEPKPLRERVPRLPVDLETIALKCLHKEPDQRYPTAKALAEDLGRYLEGEPIVGRRPRLAERLVRLARKHEAAAFMATLLMLMTLALTVYVIYSRVERRREQARAAEQAGLANELGQKAKEAEWFLRAAHAQPQHDTTRERDYVRARMAEIFARGRAAGGGGEGLAHEALGHGHLALGEFELAHREFLLARGQGVDSPELNYALGRALGELYRRALEAARRSGGPEWEAARKKAIEARYLAPALEALERGRGVKTGSPRYLEGLIALYRRDYDAAATAADQAIAETPWAYEARKLAGDVAFARAAERLERGEHEAALSSFDDAVRRYERALEFGRSDAPTYEALAAAWLERSEIDRRLGGPQRQSLDRALTAATGATEVDPGRASAHARRAFVLMRRSRLRRSEDASDGEVRAGINQWLAVAARAVELDPDDADANVVLGDAYLERAMQDTQVGRDPTAAWGEAVRWLSRTLLLEPAFPRGLNDLAALYLTQGRELVARAADPRDAFVEAERYLRETIKSDPAYVRAYTNLADIHANLGFYEILRGRSPEPDVAQALEATDQALAIDPRYYPALNHAAFAELVRAEYLVAHGDDPQPALERAFGFVDRSLASNDAFGRTWYFRAWGHCLAAQHALLAGDDPRAALAAAGRALDEAARRDRTSSDSRLQGSLMLQLEAKWAGLQGRDVLPPLRRALDEAKAALALDPSYANSHQELARVSLRLAEALPPGAAAGPIGEGLAHAERALALAPDLADAHATRAALLLARARTARDASARLGGARTASNEFERAFGLNPLLRRDLEGLAQDAKALAAETQSAPASPGP